MKIFFLILISIQGLSSELPRDSIYHLSSTWTNSSNEKIQLKHFKNEKILMTMIYTKCAHACPFTIQKVKEIDLQGKNSNYKVILISFDPNLDTPEHNLKYLKSRRLDLKRWDILTAQSDSDVREIAAILDVNYKAIGQGEFIHSNVIAVINEKGQIEAKINDVDADIAPLVISLNKQ